MSPLLTWEGTGDVPNFCPEGCGGITEDPYGGPCQACWDKVGKSVTEEGEQCIDCLRFGYDPHQDICLICGRGQLRPESDDDDSMADIIPDDWCGEAM